jgi:hypothetical protein
MKRRASKVVALIVIVAAVSGCKLLDKKKWTDVDTTPSPSPSSPMPLAHQELPAVNHSQILRFPDEVPLYGVSAPVRQFTFARTIPNESGPYVSPIAADSLVQKFAERAGYTLVAFDRPDVPGRYAGWISNVAFIPGTSVAAKSVPTPATGRCKLELRVSGFVPSSPSCSFNEKVRSGSPTTINFPCSGGITTAKFGAQTFAGTASTTKVSLTQVETFPFNGCQVRSTQSITGTPPNLQYSYAENVVSGSCKSTFTCTARAVITAL